jgi:hypothetical protein
MSKKLNDLQVELDEILNKKVNLSSTIKTERRGYTMAENDLYNMYDKRIMEINKQIVSEQKTEEDNKRKVSYNPINTSNDSFRDWMNQSIDGTTKANFRIDYRVDPILSTSNSDITLKTVEPLDIMVSPSQQLLSDLGVKFYTNLKGEKILPYMDEDTAEFVAEYVAGNDSSMNTLTNKLSWRRIQHTQSITREALASTSDDLYNKLLENLVTGLWNRLALDYFDQLDADASTQIKPILGATLAYEDLLLMEASLGAYALGKPAYVMGPMTKSFLKKTTKLENAQHTIWEDNKVNDYPSYMTPAVNGEKVYFGDFSKSVIGIWEPGIEIVIDPFTKAKEGVIVLTALMMADCGVHNPKSFCILEDASTF